jgi:hypothetical protein
VAGSRVVAAHGGAEVEPVLPGDDVVVLVLMQLNVAVVVLAYISHVLGAKDTEVFWYIFVCV